MIASPGVSLCIYSHARACEKFQKCRAVGMRLKVWCLCVVMYRASCVQHNKDSFNIICFRSR